MFHQGDGENSGTAAGGMSDLAKNPQDDFMDVVEKAQAVIPPERYAKRVRQPLPYARLLVGQRTERGGALGAGDLLPREG